MNETTKKPKGFVCYLNNHVMLKHLTDSEAGQLWKLLYRFAETGEAGESDSGMVNMLFDSMSQQMEKDFALYEKRCKANRENGKKGGLAKAANLANASERQATLSESGQYKDKYKDKDKDKHKDKDKASAGADAFAAADVLSLYNLICVSLPAVSELRDEEVRLVNQSPQVDFEAYFKRVEASAFLSGRSGRWNGCTLRWLLRPDTIAKVTSGLYDDRPKPKQSTAQHKPSYDMREIEAIDTLDWIE